MQRPKPDETEEDLMKLQTEFLSSGNATTTNVVATKFSNKRRQEKKCEDTNISRDVVKMDGVEFPETPMSSSHPTPSKKSKFVSLKTPEPASAKAPETVSNEDVEEMMDRKDTGLAAVLTTIIERDTRNQKISVPSFGNQAFPSVLRNENLLQNTGIQLNDAGSKRKKKSLFAQHIEAKTAKEFGVDRPATACTRDLGSSIPTFHKDSASSCVIDGRGLSASNSNDEAQKIHEENLDRLRSMHEAEIMEERQKLIESLDPKLLSYLKKKRQEKEGDVASCTDDVVKQTTFSVQKAIKKQQSGNKEQKSRLPVQPDKKWVNMDVVERDKLEWMKDLPPPSSVSSETGKPARFDFEGNLLAVDEDIPVHKGLHHHGEEPERAGYTLQELFLLARSSNLQQRILSLRTLANIIRKAKSGDLSELTEGPIIPVLLDGGLALLLRWALDDSVEGVVFEAVNALHALLWSPSDEEAIDVNWSAHLGHLAMALTPSATLEEWSPPDELDEENKEEETDGDVLKRDIVEALVRRTHLLTRFGFILHSMRPQAPVVVRIMSVLCRVAQHSSTMAYEIVKCPGLMDKIVKEILPTAWSVQDPSSPISDVYGLPVPHALRLIRCLAQTGKNMTASLISSCHLPAVILRYLAVDASDLHLPLLEASNLQKEALSVWRVVASYGLSTETFFNLYEVIIHMIGKIGDNWGSSMKKSKELSHLASLVCVLKQVVCGTVPGNAFGDGNQSASHVMPVNWSHVSSLFCPIRTFVMEALKAIGETYPVQKQDLVLPTSCLNFLASFYDIESKQTGIDQVSRLEELESLCNDCLVPFLSSYGLTLIREHLCSYSNVLSSSWTPLPEITTNLPSLKTYNKSSLNSDDKKLNVPILLPHSPFSFMVSLYRLVLSVCRRHKNLIPQLLPSMVDNADLLMYMRKVCHCATSPLGSSLWTRSENLLHYYWLKACILKPCPDMALAHHISLRLLSRLSKGDEFLVHDLMTSVIFSPLFIVEGQEQNLAAEAISRLSLSESLYLKSATLEDISLSKSQLLKEAHSALAAIRGHFILSLSGMEQAVAESRSLHVGNVQGVKNLLETCDGESLMPLDWIYMPLIHVYNKATQLKSVPGSEITSKDIAMVTSVLQWSYLLEIWRPIEVEKISLLTRLSRVMCAFIAGNDMFLEKGVQKYLAGLFRVMANHKDLDRMNLDENVPGITSFYDLYQEFVEHYDSVSFGDPVFGLYVLLPLQQRHSPMYRKALWGERRKILRSMRVSIQQMLIPVENFLQPEEPDLELLNLYVQALVSGSVQMSPVLYLVAVHHVNRFLFISHDDGNVSVRERHWKLVASQYKKIPAVVYYKNFNTGKADGMECYDVLPSNRQDILDRHVKDH